MPHSRYLTIVVQDKASLEWEVMIEDIREEAHSEQDLIDGIAEWTRKREAVYPSLHWRVWAVVSESPRKWRRAFVAQNKARAPISSVRPAYRSAR